MVNRIKKMSSEEIVSSIIRYVIICVIAVVCAFLGKLSTASTLSGHLIASVLFWGGNIVKLIVIIPLVKSLCAALYKLLKAAEVLIKQSNEQS